MRFLIDAQLPPALSIWLQDRGHEAAHVFDFGLFEAEDDDIWLEACQREAVLITKDEDFLLIAQRSPDGAAVVWLRIGNAANRMLFTWLDVRWARIEHALAAGEKIIEAR